MNTSFHNSGVCNVLSCQYLRSLILEIIWKNYKSWKKGSDGKIIGKFTYSIERGINPLKKGKLQASMFIFEIEIPLKDILYPCATH